MKPLKIFLVRHGESEGNINRDIYKDKPDYALLLTPKGHEQAKTAGAQLYKRIGDHKVMFYISPFFRTRQTFLEIQKCFPHHKLYEDPRLREQEWGQRLESREGYKDLVEKERDAYGHFYYRFGDGGESCADGYDRSSDIINTMHRDFEKEDFPRYVIMVVHGMSMRFFVMRWFHISVETFETWANPKNCEIWEMELQEDGKYKLLVKPRTHVIRHSFQFDWGDYKNI